MSNSSKSVVLSVDEWNTSAIKFMAPRVNDRGGKAISIISTATNRTLSISTPLLMTWGISDFVDEKTGESDGKYTLSLAFPNDEYATPGATKFLEKLKKFETTIIDEAVKNSVLWWGGKPMSRDIVEYNYFPFLKYSKNKETKVVDYTRPPTVRAKVPNYDGKWNVEIYDTASNLLFPGASTDLRTPIDFVPKQSSVACVLQCGGIWIGGKGWGLTWKLVQCVVKPREVVSIFGKCQIQLSSEERAALESDKPVSSNASDPDDDGQVYAVAANLGNVAVADSDDEVTPTPAPVKKVVKKVAPIEQPVQVQVQEPVAAPQEPEPVVEQSEEKEPVQAEVVAAAPVVVKKKIVKKASA
jgi:hypothetical protein